MQIKNVKVYGLEESIIRSGYPMQVGEPVELYYGDGYLDPDAKSDKDYIRSNKLATTPTGSGHNNFLKGIIVQFDLKYPQYFTPQLQRYHWIDIISSQSKMHRLTSVIGVKDNCNKYVIEEITSIIDAMIAVYNAYDESDYPITMTAIDIQLKSKQKLFQYIISNLPMGYEMWMGISTNYLQLKTIYNQRKNHKLKDDWGYFCDWIKTLPNSELIIGNDTTK